MSRESQLETEDVVHRSDPAPNLRENGATAEEIAFLRTRRVELNAFASADFVAWVERKLEQHGVTKVVPHQDALMLAYRRSVASRYVASRLRNTIEKSASARSRSARAGRPRHARCGRAAGRSRAVVDDVIQRLAMRRIGPDEG